MNGVKVLVVEDEASIRRFIRINLERNGFEVYEAQSGEKALEIIGANHPQVAVLDIMLPGIDGLEVCRRIRNKASNIVIIMLTAKGQDADKILGLELGADDYMVKPFNPLELVARIRAILRRLGKSGNETDEPIVFHNLLLDIKSQRFFKGGVEIELTPTEFSLLKLFMKNTNRALSRNEVLNEVWGTNYFGDLKTVDVYIRRLREKIEDNPSEPRLIETVWGYGYRWARGETALQS